VVDTHAALFAGGYRNFGLWNIQQLLQLRVIVNGKAIHALILSPAAFFRDI
jgi:hypothetical protein